MSMTTTFARLKRDVRRTAAEDGFTTFDDDKIASSIPDGFAKLEALRDWSYLRKTLRISTVRKYQISDDGATIAYTDGSTDMTGTGTLFQTATELGGLGVKKGDYIEVNGEQTWYEVSSDAASETALRVVSPYRGTSDSGKDALIVRPAIDLPEDFKSFRELVPIGGISRITYVEPERMLDLHQNFAGASMPWHWTIVEKNDDQAQRLMFYPPPDQVYQYDFRYNRLIGFMDISAGNAFIRGQTTLPADGDIVTWPDTRMAVLRAAIICAAYEEFKPSMARLAQERLDRAFSDAAAIDNHNKEPMVLGGSMPARPHWY